MDKVTLYNNMKPLLDSSSSEKKKSEETPNSFSEMLKDSIDEINHLQSKADEAIEDLASGQSNNIHETMIALEKADVSFRLMLQVRNKIVEAYQEVMRMPV